MKSTRLLELLLLLQAKAPRSAAELSRSLEVTPRTIYRDVDALGAAGIPIYTIRGPQGGITLHEGYRQAIAHLKEDEIGALFISGADPLIDLGVGENLALAREKLFGALTNRQRALALKAGSRIRIDPRQWAQGRPPVEALSVMRVAVWEDRSVEVYYQDQKGKSGPRRLDPLGIVFKAGVWYVVARVGGAKVATFRAERMSNAKLLDEHFTRPNPFDLGEYWERSIKSYEKKAAPIIVAVTGTKEAIEQLAVFWPTKITSTRNALAVFAEVTFPLRGLAVRELLVWSAEIEVQSPDTVRNDVGSRLRAGFQRYNLTGGEHNG